MALDLNKFKLNILQIEYILSLKCSLPIRSCDALSLPHALNRWAAASACVNRIFTHRWDSNTEKL